MLCTGGSVGLAGLRRVPLSANPFQSTLQHDHLSRAHFRLVCRCSAPDPTGNPCPRPTSTFQDFPRSLLCGKQTCREGSRWRLPTRESASFHPRRPPLYTCTVPSAVCSRVVGRENLHCRFSMRGRKRCCSLGVARTPRTLDRDVTALHTDVLLVVGPYACLHVLLTVAT